MKTLIKMNNTMTMLKERKLDYNLINNNYSLLMSLLIYYCCCCCATVVVVVVFFALAVAALRAFAPSNVPDQPKISGETNKNVNRQSLLVSFQPNKLKLGRVFIRNFMYHMI